MNRQFERRYEKQPHQSNWTKTGCRRGSNGRITTYFPPRLQLTPPKNPAPLHPLVAVWFLGAWEGYFDPARNSGRSGWIAAFDNSLNG